MNSLTTLRRGYIGPDNRIAAFGRMQCRTHSDRQTHQICYIPPYFGYYESTRIRQTLHDEDRPTLRTTRGNGGRSGSSLGQILLALCGRRARPGAPALYLASPTDGRTVRAGDPAPCHQPASVRRRQPELVGEMDPRAGVRLQQHPLVISRTIPFLLATRIPSTIPSDPLGSPSARYSTPSS